MSKSGEYNFTLELPYGVISKMDPIELPANMHRRYENFLNNEIDKSSKTFKKLQEREKMSANIIVLGEIIHLMIVDDVSFDEAYDSIRDSIGEMMENIDEIFGELLEEEEATKLFKQLFQNLIKMAKKREDNMSDEKEDDKLFVSINDVQDEVIESLDEHGVDYLAAEILADDGMSKEIEDRYIKPIQGLLKEYIVLFIDENEDDYYNMFSTLFVQSKSFIVYQALLNNIISQAILKGLSISETLKVLDRDTLVSDSKKMILNYESLDDYKEEIENIMKLLLKEKTQ
ncbi:MAG: hypothetical protein OSJ70_06845 [Bacilli bacterium]|nr:hypothetical protein [Bacilli bacterium]